MFAILGTALKRLSLVLTRLSTATSRRNRPGQVAAAVSLGICCGLLPYTSGCLWLAVLGLFVLPVHLPLAIGTALIVTWIGPNLQPVLGGLGLWSLGHEQVLRQVSQLNEFPLVPWLGLNNTVVHGALIVGCLQLIPSFLIVFRLAKPVSEKTPSERAENRVEAHVHELVPHVSYAYRELELSRPKSIQPVADICLEPAQPSSSEVWSPVEKVESFLADCSDTDMGQSGSIDIATRAAELTSLVEEMLVALNESDEQPEVKVEAHVSSALEDTSAYDESLVAERADSAGGGSALESEINLDASRSSSAPEANEDPASAGNGIRLKKAHGSHIGVEAASSASVANKVGYSPLVSPQDEALRYLLHHLREINNKA